MRRRRPGPASPHRLCSRASTFQLRVVDHSHSRKEYKNHRECSRIAVCSVYIAFCRIEPMGAAPALSRALPAGSVAAPHKVFRRIARCFCGPRRKLLLSTICQTCMCLLPVIVMLNFMERHGEWCSGCLHSVPWTVNDMNEPGIPFASLNRHGSVV